MRACARERVEVELRNKKKLKKKIQKDSRRDLPLLGGEPRDDQLRPQRCLEGAPGQREREAGRWRREEFSLNCGFRLCYYLRVLFVSVFEGERRRRPRRLRPRRRRAPQRRIGELRREGRASSMRLSRMERSRRERSTCQSVGPAEGRRGRGARCCWREHRCFCLSSERARERASALDFVSE